MVDIPIACSSSMGASSTGGILLMGCLSLLLWGYSYRLCRWAAFPPLPFSGLARACDAWLPPTVASADVSPRSSRFAKSCAALSAGRPVDGRGRADPSGLGRARERSEESSRGNLSPAQRQIAAAERRRRASSTPRLPVVEGHRGATGSRRNRPKRFGQLFSVRGATDSGIN